MAVAEHVMNVGLTDAGQDTLAAALVTMAVIEPGSFPRSV